MVLPRFMLSPFADSSNSFPNPIWEWRSSRVSLIIAIIGRVERKKLRDDHIAKDPDR